MRRALAVLAAVTPFGAAAQDCRLSLLIAMDVSSSVDAAEDALQRGGVAGALRDAEVRRAFLSGAPVALAVYEWSGRQKQEVLVDWRLVLSEVDLDAAADRIEGLRRSHDDFPTAMGYALGFGARMLEDGPDCLFRTLDMAGDGVNNEGFGPAAAYREFPFQGVTVNGLAVQTGEPAVQSELFDFYRDEVLHGPGAFLEMARGFRDYEDAMRRKLLRELATPAIGALDPGAGERPG